MDIFKIIEISLISPLLITRKSKKAISSFFHPKHLKNDPIESLRIDYPG